MLAVAAAVRFAAGIVAFSEVTLTNAVGSAAPFQQTTDLALKFDPVTRIWTLGAFCADAAPVLAGVTAAVFGFSALIFGVGGAAIWNVRADDGAALGLESVMDAAPTEAIFSAGTTAVTTPEERTVVTSGAPFQLTVALLIHLEPRTVSVNDPPPASADAGVRLLMIGVQGLTVKLSGAVVIDFPLTSVVTVTANVFGAPIKAAGTVAVSLLAETNVVASGMLVHQTTELAWKFVPVTVSVKSGSPFFAAFGLSAVRVGSAVTVNAAGVDTP